MNTLRKNYPTPLTIDILRIRLALCASITCVDPIDPYAKFEYDGSSAVEDIDNREELFSSRNLNCSHVDQMAKSYGTCE